MSLNIPKRTPLRCIHFSLFAVPNLHATLHGYVPTDAGGEGCRGEIPPGTDLQRRNPTAKALTITVICIQSYTFLLIIVLVNYKNILFIYIRIIYTCIISINRPLSSFFSRKWSLWNHWHLLRISHNPAGFICLLLSFARTKRSCIWCLWITFLYTSRITHNFLYAIYQSRILYLRLWASDNGKVYGAGLSELSCTHTLDFTRIKNNNGTNCYPFLKCIQFAPFDNFLQVPTHCLRFCTCTNIEA